MVIFRRIFKVAAVVTAFCALFVTSCQKPSDEEDDALEVSVRTPSVDSGKGQMFVNVKCSSSWTLSVAAAEDDRLGQPQCHFRQR